MISSLVVAAPRSERRSVQKPGPLRAVIIIGGDNSGDLGSIPKCAASGVVALKETLDALGIGWMEFNSKNSTHESIADAVDGASFIIYTGHGDADHGGLALARRDGLIDMLPGQEIERTWHPAPGCLVIFGGSDIPCGSNGTSSVDNPHSRVLYETAVRRVRAFASPFISLGCDYVSGPVNFDLGVAGIIRRYVKGGDSLGQAFKFAFVAPAKPHKNAQGSYVLSGTKDQLMKAQMANGQAALWLVASRTMSNEEMADTLRRIGVRRRRFDSNGFRMPDPARSFWNAAMAGNPDHHLKR